jgi:polysaccharide export outer membrane protein
MFIFVVPAQCLAAPAASPAPTVQIPDTETLPPPSDADSVADASAYRIGPLDRLTIDVYGIKDMTQREVQADASGRISFPLVGVIEVAGATPVELAETIRRRLKANFIRDPQVTVNLKETISQTVTVNGEVKEPGIYPVIGDMTLLRAVATAKGTTEFARQQKVLIFRTVAGVQLAREYDLKLIMRGKDSDPRVYANDIVVVNESSTRRLLKGTLSALPAITAPLYLLLRQ